MIAIASATAFTACQTAPTAYPTRTAIEYRLPSPSPSSNPSPTDAALSLRPSVPQFLPPVPTPTKPIATVTAIVVAQAQAETAEDPTPVPQAARPVSPTSRALTHEQRVEGARAILSSPVRPLEPFAEMLVTVAEQYGIDYRLLPAISIWESGGGAQACGFNAWGYLSCAVTFASWEEGAAACAQLLVDLGARENIDYALRQWVAGANNAWTERASSYVARVTATLEIAP